MSSPVWDPGDTLLDKPNPARMYDYFLGGFHNFEIDRQAAEQVIALHPDTPLITQTNRAFLRRAVNYLIAQGIDQFLDIGSGIPTVGNVHEVALQKNPDARVVYVDIDPIAVRFSESILQHTPNVRAIQADARQPDQILDYPDVRDLLDLNRPLAVLLIALLHFIIDDTQAFEIVDTFKEAIPAGSFIAITHTTHEHLPPEVYERGRQLYEQTTNPVILRSRDQIARFFTGLELVEPGLVYVPLWHPEEPDDLFLDQPARSISFAGIGRKS